MIICVPLGTITLSSLPPSLLVRGTERGITMSSAALKDRFSLKNANGVLLPGKTHCLREKCTGR